MYKYVNGKYAQFNDALENNAYVGSSQWPKKPKNICTCDYENLKTNKYCSDCGSKLNYQDKLDQYNVDMVEYHKETNLLFETFKKDLFHYLGISDNPKNQMLFDVAWDKGHASGYMSILEEAEELVDLII